MATVEAVRDQVTIDKIRSMLKQVDPIYSDIWGLGINTILRIQDLLNIKVADIDLDRRVYALCEGKTAKKRVIDINDKALAIISRRMLENPTDVYLFQSHSPKLMRGSKTLKRKLAPGERFAVQPISVTAVARRFQAVGESLGIALGTHSMRKTAGRYLFREKGYRIEELMNIFNHSSASITLRYIGITSEDVARSYYDLEL